MYPNHKELIEFIKLLGYEEYSDGICYGIEEPKTKCPPYFEAKSYSTRECSNTSKIGIPVSP